MEKEHCEVTKKGYLKKPGRQDFLNFVSCAWDKISFACVKNAFVAAQIVKRERAADTKIIPDMESNNESAENFSV